MMIRSTHFLALSILSLTAAACTASTATSNDGATEEAATRTDLATDLAKRGGDRGSPFHAGSERALPSRIASELDALVARCIEYHTEVDPRGNVYGLPTKSVCPTELTNRIVNDTKLTEKMDVVLPSGRLTAVIWDNEDSDGGDMTDIALYDARGKRIGVYRTVMVNDTVLDTLSGITTTPVRSITDAYTPKNIMDRDMLATGVSPVAAGDENPLSADLAARIRGQLEACVEKHVSASTGAVTIAVNPVGRAFCIDFGGPTNSRGNMTWESLFVPVPAHPTTNPDLAHLATWETATGADVVFYTSDDANVRGAVYRNVPKAGGLWAQVASAVGASLRTVSVP